MVLNLTANMTRTLPWVSRSSESKTSRIRTTTMAPRTKRQRLVDPSSETDDVETRKSPAHSTPIIRERRESTSPVQPLEAPLESFMIEGMENDDGYRMVEDEFMDVAKQFTQHLHAAEYQKMKKAAKARNAQTFGRISRPVSNRMPGETRRKVESVARANAQAGVVRNLLGREAQALESNDEDDGVEGPWVGTALHGLMDSPRKKAPSLMRIDGFRSDTRAAPGFSRSHISRSLQSSPSSSQKLANRPAPKRARDQKKANQEETSSNDDDDLNVPLRRPKLPTPRTKTYTSPAVISPPVTGAAKYVTSQVRTAPTKKLDSEKKSSTTKVLEKSTETSASRAVLDSKARIARRLEQARAQKIKAEKEARNTRVDDIPTFL